MIRLGLLVLALGAWLSLPRFRSSEDKPLTVFLLDTSASSVVGFEFWDGPEAEVVQAYARWLREAVQGALAHSSWSGGEAEVITFASGARKLWGPLPAARIQRTIRFSPTGELLSRLGRSSNLDSAVARAESALAGRTHARLVLLGDGSYSGADPGPRLAALAARGVAFEQLAPPRRLPDLALSRLDMAPRFAGGETARATLEVVLQPALEPPLAGQGLAFDLKLELTGPDGQPQLLRPWPAARFLDPATERLTAQIELGVLAPGAWRLRATLEPLDGFPLNDTLTANFMVGPARRVLVASRAASEADARAFFGAGMRGLALDYVRPAELEARLDETDLLVTWDLPLSSLPAARLVSAIGTGLGWLSLGAWGQLADPAGADPALEALLPLVLDDRDMPPRRVLLCVDGSGSMSGAPFDAVRRAASELVRATPPRDSVSLTFFTNTLGAEWLIRPALQGPLVDEHHAEDGDQLAELMRAEVPGGHTRILDALEQLATRRRAQAAVPALVILLSDGAENGLDVNDPRSLALACEAARELTGDLEASGTTLAVVSINVSERSAREAAAAHGLLQALVRPGGQLYEVGIERGSRELLEVFAREVAARLIASGDFEVEPAAGELAAELGDLGASVATLARLRLAPGARLLASARERGALADAERLPLLAVKRAGGRARAHAGQVALLATAPGSSWAPAWTRADSLAPLLAWLAADRGRRELVARRRGAWLELDGAESLFEGATLPAQLDVSLRAAGAQGHTTLELAATAGGPARYRARLAPEWAAATGLEVDLSSADPMALGELLATLGAPAEASAGEGAPDRPRLGPVPSAAANAAGTARRPGPHGAAPWVIGLALGLLFAGLLKRQ